MIVRLKEPDIKRKAGDGIDISDDHVISVLLRATNNLIHVNENRELYVDLQLDDEIPLDYDFPVWVTTWRILAEDGWEQSWTILNWKTTSWDYNRLIYANDGNLYRDAWNWIWVLIWWAESAAWNVKRFIISGMEDSVNWQWIVDWYRLWKCPIVQYNWNTYLLDNVSIDWRLRFINTFTTVYNMMSYWKSYVGQNRLYVVYDPSTWEWDNMSIDVEIVSPQVIWIGLNYDTPFIPQTAWDPTSKKYVDDELLKKQDKLIAWNGITIDVDNVISANIVNVYTYRWSIATQSDLGNITNPAVWDVYYTEDTGISYAWNWTIWTSLGTVVNLSPYFNKNIDDSDDITQWSTNLFVTSVEKNYWNGKQNALTPGTWIVIDPNTNTISARIYTAWTWINITNWFQIENTLPFNPENEWVLWYVLKKTSNWYRWATETVTSVNWDTWEVIIPLFEPSNAGTVGQVLKKTSTWYSWQDESWWGWWGWGWDYTAWYWIDITHWEISNTKPFDPTTIWAVWNILKKTANWYEWSEDSNVKLFELSGTSDLTNAEKVYNFLKSWWLPIIKYHGTFGYEPKTADYFFYPVIDSTSWSDILFEAKITSNNYFIQPSWTVRPSRPRITLSTSNNHVTSIWIWEATAARCETARNWIWTQAQFNNLWTYEDWVIYNIKAN